MDLSKNVQNEGLCESKTKKNTIRQKDTLYKMTK